MRDKLTTLPDAIRHLVRDGDSVVLGACLEPNIPFAATYEIIRQGRRGLRMVAPISDASTDMLIGAGCVATIETSGVSLGEFGQAPAGARVGDGRLDHQERLLARPQPERLVDPAQALVEGADAAKAALAGAPAHRVEDGAGRLVAGQAGAEFIVVGGVDDDGGSLGGHRSLLAAPRSSTRPRSG